MTDDFKNFIKRRPLGVVFVIAPWNYPYLTAVNGEFPCSERAHFLIKH